MRLVSCLFLFISYFSYSQEIVSDLIFNTQIGQDKYLIHERTMSSLSLPFFDDFRIIKDIQSQLTGKTKTPLLTLIFLLNHLIQELPH